MHEMSLMENLLSVATESLAHYTVKSVQRLTVSAGVLANIMPDAFDFAFAMQREDTIFAGAELLVNKAPIQASCRNCSCEYESFSIPFTCPACGNEAAEILHGAEVFLESIDFEEVEKQ